MDPIFLITLTTMRSVIAFISVAALCGLIGGVVAELLVARGKRKETGLWERTRRQGRFFDVGSLASLPIGLVAGVIASYLFSPARQVVTATGTTTQYDLVRLVAVALLAGLSSSTFLAVLQERFTALATADRLKQALISAADALPGSAIADHPLADLVDGGPGGAGGGPEVIGLLPVEQGDLNTQVALARTHIMRALKSTN